MGWDWRGGDEIADIRRLAMGGVEVVAKLVRFWIGEIFCRLFHGQAH